MKRLLFAATCLLVAACAPAPQAPVTAGSAAPATTPTASTAPSAAPGTASATATPAASLFALSPGVSAATYAFKSIGGVYFDAALQQIVVVDTLHLSASPHLYHLLKFGADGSFLAANSLAPASNPDPDTVGGMAFDLTGRAYYGYHNGEAWQLDQLVSATVQQATALPLNTLERSGPSTVGAQGNIVNVAAVWLDPTVKTPLEHQTKTGGNIDISRKDVGTTKPPLTIIQVPDPLWPTVLMGFDGQGNLLVCGPLQQGGFAVKRIAPDKTVSTVPLGLTAMPDGMWVAPDGTIYTTMNTQGQAATIRQYAANGTLRGQTALKLEGGGYLYHIGGVAFDSKGNLLIGGDGYDANGTAITAVYSFAGGKS